MSPEMTAPIPESGSSWPEFQGITVTEAFESIPHDDWGGPWKLVSVPSSEIDSASSQWHQEKSKPGIRVIGKCDYNDDDGAYEVAIDPPYLPGLKVRQFKMNLDHDPIHPGERQINVFGIHNATRRVRDRWLRHAANVIRSEHPPEVEWTFRYLARSNGVQEQLERAILVHDISVLSTGVKLELAQNLMRLFLNFEKDHESPEAREYCESDHEDLVLALQFALPIRQPAERTKQDEAQITSLVRALLELSGGRVDCHQHGFAEEYTSSENADLYASVLGITRTNEFGNVDREQMRKTLSKSQVFSGMTITVHDLEEWTMKTIDALPIGFQKGHLNFPSQVLSGFGSRQVDMVGAYLEHMYCTIPSLRKPENNVPLLLTWGMSVSGRQLEVLGEWARSENGLNLYNQLIRDFQVSQCAEQLALTMAALMCHRRLLPYLSDDYTQPINGSYVADLDALLNGHSLENSKMVWERMVFSLLRVLSSFTNQYEDLIQFLASVLDRETPLLDPFDGFSDQYLTRRINGQPHETVILKLSHLKMPELRKDDDLGWVTVAPSETF